MKTVILLLGLFVLVSGNQENQECELDTPDIVKSMLYDWLDLTKTWTEGYKYFIEPPVPALIKFTFFEVTNYQEVSAGLAKPYLVDRGPYVYREERFKQDLKWNTSQFIEFGQFKIYTFVPEKSCKGCTEDDQVRILNMPLAGLIAQMAAVGGYTSIIVFNKIEQLLVSGLDELFPETTVGDFLFRGINTGAAKWMMNDALTKDRLPPTFTPENGFALFNGKQDNSENACYQVETSAEAWNRHAMITKWGKDMDSLLDDLSTANTCTWNGKHCQRWWPNADANGHTGEFSECNQIRGTDGTQFPPFMNIDDQEELWVFDTLPCRSVEMRYKAHVNIEGVPALKYRVPRDAANVNKKSNVCLCKELSDLIADGDQCVRTVEDDPNTLDISNCNIKNCYDGLQDITSCQGTPTFLSYPHFYLADAQQDNFDGLSPDPNLHLTYLIVEPNSGLTLRRHSRYQFNIPVLNSEDLPCTAHGCGNLTILNNITTVPAFPVLWIDEGTDESCYQ